MGANDSVRDLIDGIVACDDQPSEEQMTELRKSLAAKVATMKRRARHSRSACVAGIVLFAIGYVPLLFASPYHQPPDWLVATALSFLLVGAMLTIVGAVGFFLFHGFGYVWARNDLQDAAIMELSLQVQRLAHLIEAPKKNS